MKTLKKQYTAPQIEETYVLTGNLLDGFSKTETTDGTGGNAGGPDTGEFAKEHNYNVWGSEEEEDK